MDRFLKMSSLRELEKQVLKGVISHSRMLEIINMEAFKFYVINKMDVDLDSTIKSIVNHLMNDNYREVYNRKDWSIDDISSTMIQSMVKTKAKP